MRDRHCDTFESCADLRLASTRVPDELLRHSTHYNTACQLLVQFAYRTVVAVYRYVHEVIYSSHSKLKLFSSAYERKKDHRSWPLEHVSTDIISNLE